MRRRRRFSLPDATLHCQQPSQLDRVVDGGAGAGDIAALALMLAGGEFEGDEEIGHQRVLHLSFFDEMGRVPRHEG